MEFASLGSRFIELLDSDVGKAALGGSGSGFKKFLATIKLAQNQTEVNNELIDRQYEIIESENHDRIVYSNTLPSSGDRVFKGGVLLERLEIDEEQDVQVWNG